jgi:hypothetical protein
MSRRGQAVLCTRGRRTWNRRGQREAWRRWISGVDQKNWNSSCCWTSHARCWVAKTQTQNDLGCSEDRGMKRKRETGAAGKPKNWQPAELLTKCTGRAKMRKNHMWMDEPRWEKITCESRQKQNSGGVLSLNRGAHKWNEKSPRSRDNGKNGRTQAKCKKIMFLIEIYTRLQPSYGGHRPLSLI